MCGPKDAGSASSSSSSSQAVSSTESTDDMGRVKWRGVSLGGWLLLEPGTAHELFEKHRGDKGEKLKCEWDLMRVLRKRGALSDLEEHREKCISKLDFERIKGMGLNAVRVPFGYWIAIGKTCRDPYEGPALDYLDRAVQWAEECGLEVLLDLHGAPGGESGEAPCGHRRPAGSWKWENWRFNASLRVLRIIASRYRSSKAVTGIAVCNEPSPQVPSDVLLSFYKRAVDVVRKAGMLSDRVTVVLPVFQRSLEEFVQKWDADMGGDRHGICFEVHWYHCFENEWNGRTFAQHLRTVQEHAHELRRFPVVVGEWSLALGCGAYHGRLSKEEMRALFAHAQLAAYQAASHGWFFWNWRDHHSIDWDWQEAYKEGYLPVTSDLLEFPDLPPGTDAISDPLEAVFDTPPTEPRIRLGDTVYLRAFNGRYLDVDGPHVRARWSDRGKWQQFVLCPFGCHDPNDESSLCDGDIVSLLAHNNCYLGVKDTQVSASWKVIEDACAFVVRTQGTEELVHRSSVFLQSLSTSKVLAPNENDPKEKDRLLARWQDFGSWQKFIIEKPLSTAVTPRRPRRRSSFPGQVPRLSLCGTPMSQRRSSINGRRSSVPGRSSIIARRSSSSNDLASNDLAEASVDSAPAEQPTRTLRRRSSCGSDFGSALAPMTPMRSATARRCSGASAATAVLATPAPATPASAAPDTTDAPEAIDETPCSRRRRHSLGPDDLSTVATPSRRRRLSTKCKDFETPAGKDLVSAFDGI